ncbi:MAG: hypothetical protein KC502_17535 [Myxococcales bacterium]|nr:hypothetical protein [Myxococcales bacterium]
MSMRPRSKSKAMKTAAATKAKVPRKQRGGKSTPKLKPSGGLNTMSYAAGKAAVKPAPEKPTAPTARVDFENLEVISSYELTEEMGLSGLQRAQMEAGIAYIDSADEAFDYSDEQSYTVEKVVCAATGQQFTRVTYYAGDTACGYIVDVGTANVRATIEDGEVVPS